MPLVTYSALRLGLLAVCFGLGYAAGLRTWLLLGVAVLAAWGLSYVLLAGPRQAAATFLAERVEGRRAGARRFPGSADDDAAHEDALVDDALGDRDDTHDADEDHADADRGRPPAAPSATPSATPSVTPSAATRAETTRPEPTRPEPS